MAKKVKPDDFRRKLSELQTLYGSAKEAAKRIGVSTKTFSNYKSGKTAPRDPNITKKVNRLRGANTKKVNADDFKEKLEKREAKEEKARIKREESAAQKIESIPLKDWIAKTLIGISTQLKNEIELVSMYASYNGNDSLMIQFWDGGNHGKPKGIKRVKTWAIYGAVGSKGGELQIDDSLPRYLIEAPFAMLERLKDDWTITEVNDFIETKLGNPSTMRGRQRYMLTRYLGFQLY